MEKMHVAPEVIAQLKELQVFTWPLQEMAPVVHASLKYTGWDEEYCPCGDCTNCGKSNSMASKFCNNCGARLDGGDSDGSDA